MSSTGAALLAGAAGAVSLNLMHECARVTVPNSPRVDVIGMRALAAITRWLGSEPPEHLRTATFGADLLANSAYYSAVGLKGTDDSMLLGGALGLAAGVGAVLLPGPMGLGDAEVNRTPQTQAMTVGMYLAAGIVAGAVYRLTAGRDRDQRPVSGGSNW